MSDKGSESAKEPLTALASSLGEDKSEVDNLMRILGLMNSEKGVREAMKAVLDRVREVVKQPGADTELVSLVARLEEEEMRAKENGPKFRELLKAFRIEL